MVVMALSIWMRRTVVTWERLKVVPLFTAATVCVCVCGEGEGVRSRKKKERRKKKGGERSIDMICVCQ